MVLVGMWEVGKKKITYSYLDLNEKKTTKKQLTGDSLFLKHFLKKYIKTNVIQRNCKARNEILLPYFWIWLVWPSPIDSLQTVDQNFSSLS